jgi:hypothetical protein
VEKFTAQSGVVIEGTGSDPGELASVPVDPTEKSILVYCSQKLIFFRNQFRQR